MPAGPGPFRYLLYKDVNRHMSLRPGALSQPRKQRLKAAE